MTARRQTNVIAGSGIGVSVADNTTTGQQDVTITNTSPSSGGTVTSVSAGTGISITGSPTTTPTVNVAASGVGAGSYGDASHYPTFTVDATGRVTAASQVALPAGPGFVWVTAGGTLDAFGTVLGGDVSQGTHSPGTQPLTVTGLKGSALPALAAGNLNYSGSAWQFVTPTSVAGGAGISVTGGPAYTVAIAAATAHGVMTTGAGTGGFTAISPGAANTTVLTSNGASADPSYQTPLTSQWTSLNTGGTNGIGSSVTTMDSLTVTIASGQVLLIMGELGVQSSATDTINAQFNVDATTLPGDAQILAVAANLRGHLPLFKRVSGLSAGSHTVNLIAQNTTHNGTATGTWSFIAMVVSG